MQNSPTILKSDARISAEALKLNMQHIKNIPTFLAWMASGLFGLCAIASVWASPVVAFGMLLWSLSFVPVFLRLGSQVNIFGRLLAICLGVVLIGSTPKQEIARPIPSASPSPAEIAPANTPSPPSPDQNKEVASPEKPVALSKTCPVLIHGNIAGGKAIEVLQSDNTQSYWVLLTSKSQQNIFMAHGFSLVTYEDFIDTGISLESFQSIRKTVFSSYGGSENVSFASLDQDSVVNATPFFNGKSCL